MSEANRNSADKNLDPNHVEDVESEEEPDELPVGDAEQPKPDELPVGDAEHPNLQSGQQPRDNTAGEGSSSQVDAVPRPLTPPKKSTDEKKVPHSPIIRELLERPLNTERAGMSVANPNPAVKKLDLNDTENEPLPAVDAEQPNLQSEQQRDNSAGEGTSSQVVASGENPLIPPKNPNDEEQAPVSRPENLDCPNLKAMLGHTSKIAPEDQLATSPEVAPNRSIATSPTAANPPPTSPKGESVGEPVFVSPPKSRRTESATPITAVARNTRSNTRARSGSQSQTDKEDEEEPKTEGKRKDPKKKGPKK